MIYKCTDCLANCSLEIEDPLTGIFPFEFPVWCPMARDATPQWKLNGIKLANKDVQKAIIELHREMAL